MTNILALPSFAPVTISEVEVHRDVEGRYCLNDLHRAAGGEKRHQPSDWLRLDQTVELVEEVEIPGIPGIVSKQGVGTFVVRELVFAYAMWVSPKFHLRVIRTFDALTTSPALPDFTDPVAAARAWADECEAKLAAEARARALAQQIETDRPYTELAHSITSQAVMTRRDWCAMMKADHGAKISEKALTKWLIDNKFCYRDQLTGDTRAYAHHSQLFKLEVRSINGFPRTLLMVTGDGAFQLTKRIVEHFLKME